MYHKAKTLRTRTQKVTQITYDIRHAVDMPPTFVRHIPIDSEWTEALVGLRLNVPNSLWPGFFDGGLNRGRIAAINFDAPNAFYFEVQLDDELGSHYAMRYDSYDSEDGRKMLTSFFDTTINLWSDAKISNMR